LIPRKITIYYADIAGSTPAKCNRRTGDIYLNNNVIHKYKPEYKVFIILHEMGHIYCNATSEYTADEWAHNQYLLAGYTAQQAFEAAKATMPPINSELRNRIKILKANTQNMQTQNKWVPVENNDVDFLQQSDFLGFGKVARERRRGRIERLKEEASAKAYERRIKADAALELAKQGISERQLDRVNTRNSRGELLRAGTSALSNVAGAVAAGFGGGSAAAEAMAAGNRVAEGFGSKNGANFEAAADNASGGSRSIQEVEPKDKNIKKSFLKTPMGMAAIGAGVLVVVGVIFYFVKKK
jgi:hypothetical protein